jgi:hypothetical protein
MNKHRNPTKTLLDLGDGYKIKEIRKIKETIVNKVLRKEQESSSIGLFLEKKLIHDGFKTVEEAKKHYYGFK